MDEVMVRPLFWSQAADAALFPAANTLDTHQYGRRILLPRFH
jgi:hypothetical protein